MESESKNQKPDKNIETQSEKKENNDKQLRKERNTKIVIVVGGIILYIPVFITSVLETVKINNPDTTIVSIVLVILAAIFLSLQIVLMKKMPQKYKYALFWCAVVLLGTWSTIVGIQSKM